VRLNTLVYIIQSLAGSVGLSTLLCVIRVSAGSVGFGTIEYAGSLMAGESHS
jgi:hypothetical protein